MSNYPNLFVIGAPKCGTTTLDQWLSRHPQVYMSSVKELHQFNTDHKKRHGRSNRQYLEYFSDATSAHKVIGESSVWYLYSKRAIASIERFVTEPKYLVCVRNPVEMAVSLHNQEMLNGTEHIVDFAEAWSMSDERLEGRGIDKWCVEPKHLAYKQACSLGGQLLRLYDLVPKSRVHVVFLEDVIDNSRSSYESVQKFLEIDLDSEITYDRYNTAKKNRSMHVKKFVRVIGSVKENMRLPFGFGVLNSINKLNTKGVKKHQVSDSQMNLLHDYFVRDVCIIEDLLDRDLSHWRC